MRTLRKADPGMFVLKGSVRAAIVVPLAFALSLVAIDDKQMALFAAFGSMALLVFADFGGSPRARLRAYLLLLAVGALLIVLGTLCSRTTWLATVAMGLVAFAILFAGVLDDYAVAARAAVTLTFVLPVMVSAPAAEIPDRLAGWGLAGALSIPAALLLWPGRPRSALRREASQASRSLADLAETRSQGQSVAAETALREARETVISLRDRFVSMTQRPSGTSGPTAALARLIEDFGWLLRLADRPPALSGPSAPCPAERAAVELRACSALRTIAALLEGPSDATAQSQVASELAQLREVHQVFGRAQLAHFRQMRPDRDEAEAEIELDEAYRLRAIAYGILQAGRDAQLACRDVGRLSPKSLQASFARARRLLRTHANTRSVWLRNSVRWALGLALAVLVGQLADVQNSFWVVLGTMSVLRSSALSTSATIASALVGTLAGIVLGGLIVVAVGANHGVLWAVLPFAVLLAAYAPYAMSFAAGQAAFTIVVLILFNLIHPVGWRVGLVRVEDVAIGASVSLLVGLLLWPRGASTVLRGTIADAYGGASRYLDATIGALLGDGGGTEPSSSAAREALDSAQLLDTALRDYLANRSSARSHISDLTLIAAGSARIRRVARLLEDAHSFMRLAPVGDDTPRLAQARRALEDERRARCDWYETFGSAIAQTGDSPRPEAAESGGSTWSSGQSVVLEHVGNNGALQPGLAIAWAQRHLQVLAELEPLLSSAYERVRI